MTEKINHKKPGRKVGYKAPGTLKKMALKTLQNALENDLAPVEVKVAAATTLINNL